MSDMFNGLMVLPNLISLLPCIKNKKKLTKEYELKKKIFTFFILSLLIGFSHGSLELFALCSRIIGFFLLYLIRLKWNENSKFWYVVLIHFTYNLLLIIYGIMKIGV